MRFAAILTAMAGLIGIVPTGGVIYRGRAIRSAGKPHRYYKEMNFGKCPVAFVEPKPGMMAHAQRRG